MTALASPIDLRSDAVTRPTEEMWDAMQADELEWSKHHAESVDRLETCAAGITGKEAALFVLTGTMANTLALLCLTRPGDRFLADERSHVLTSEDQAFARLAHAYPRPIPGIGGHLQPDQVRQVFEESCFGHLTPTSLVWLENSHNAAGGTVSSAEATRAIAHEAHTAGAAVHVDGARLFNACQALQVRPSDLLADVDSVTINLNKALSAPAGALLCGANQMIAEARQRVVGLGGVVSQAGVFSAAGSIALEKMRSRVDEDHRVAWAIADGLRHLRKFAIPMSIDTNIVMVGVGPNTHASHVVQVLAGQGVLALAYDTQTIRLVTHRGIRAADVATVVSAFEAAGDGVRGINETVATSAQMLAGSASSSET